MSSYRYSAYVDLWELLNEASGIPPTYSEPVAAYVRAHDPYQHLITPCFAQADQTNFDVTTPHEYQSSANSAFAAIAAGDITASEIYRNTATGYLQPVYVGEFGGSGYTGAYSPERYRLALWASWFARGSINATDMGSRTEFGNTTGGLNNLTLDSQNRAESKIFTDFIATFDPAAVPVAITLAPAVKLNGHALSSPADLGVYVLRSDNQNAVLTGATVEVNVPANNMQGQWIDPTTGILLQQLTLNAGLQTIPIPVFKDDVVFRAHAGAPAQTLQFSASSYRVNSDQTNVVLSLYRLGGGGGAVTVDYATSDGLAKAGSNYTATAGTIGWRANDVAAKTITVPLINSGVLQDDKDFIVTLSNPTGGAALGAANRAMVTIVNVVTNTAVFAPTYAVTNGAGNLIIPVNRVGNGNGPLTIYYSTRANGTAVAGTDYVAIPMSTYTLTWTIGDLSPKTISVNILNNSSSTTDKTFVVALDDLGSSSVVGTSPPDCIRAWVDIQGNPASSPGVLQMSGNVGYASLSYGWFGADYAVSGTNASALLPVSRLYGSNGTVSVSYTTTAQAGTAAAGVDYTTTSGTLTWTNGETTDKIITVPLISNSASSGNLTFWLALTSPTGGAILGENAVRVTILDPATVLPPGIVLAPVNQSTTTGQTATFSVVASGTGPLSYQWIEKGTNLVGATNATYTTLPLLPADNGATFAAIVGNSGGSVTSSVATLTLTDVPPLPVITTQPSNQTVNVGQPATFTVAATSTAPLFYQWQKNQTNIMGATNATNTIAAAQPADAGSYTVIVSNSGGSVTSSNATLTVNNPAWPGWLYLKVITINHSQITATQTNFPVLIAFNDDHDLATHARSDGADLIFTDTNGNLLAYEIETSYQATNGATGGTKARVWVTPPILSSTADTVINLRYGNPSWSTSKQNAAQVWANGFAGVWHLGESASPAYDSTSNATSLAGNAGSTFGAPGEIGNGVSLDGSTGFLIANAADVLELVGSPGTISAWIYPKALNAGGRICEIGTTGTAEGYQFAIAAGNTFRYSCSSSDLVSSTSTLSVNKWQQIAAAWDGTNLRLYLQGSAAGTAPYAFYPQNNGATFKIGDSVQFVGKFNGTLDEVRISSDARSAGWIATEYNNQSNPGGFASLGSEWSAPLIVTQPSNQTMNAGQQATFSVTASNTAPLFYQWQFNGTDLVDGGGISGSTSNVLTITNVQDGDAGNYSVIVSNAYWPVTSSAATLNVWPSTPLVPTLGGGLGFSSGGFGFNLSGPSGLVAIVEASSNLLNWQPVLTNALINGQICFTDSQSFLYPERFYRANFVFASSSQLLLQANTANGSFISNQFGFNLSGIAGQTVVIEASTNLTDWIPLQTNTLLTGFYYFNDPDSTTLTSRFYRVLLLP